MEQYTVVSGDSLWKISRKLGVNIDALASINGLLTEAQQHIIHPGQKLILPAAGKAYDTQLTLRIFDLVWRPLKDARLRLTFYGKTAEHVTDGTGVLNGLLIEDSTKGIKVELQHLDQKTYILIANHKSLPLGKKTLTISSREMVIKGSTLVKKGTQQSTKQQEKALAKQARTPVINQTTRTEGGVPTNVSNIGNVSEGLRLPPEAEKYRDDIIATAKKYDFQPEGLAALIYAESRWQAGAENTSGSGAVGLGQFKPDAWLSGCTSPQSKVYQSELSKFGYSNIEYRHKKLWGTLPDGSEVEINKEAVLSLRKKPEYNIDMIGLYDRQGIELLGSKLPSVTSLEPDELVKIAYLVHMNGYFGAYDIIMNGAEIPGRGENIPTEGGFKERLHRNLKNSEKEKRYHSIDGLWRTAFVAWMVGYFDSIIVPDHYRVIPRGKDYATKDVIQKLNPVYVINTDLPPSETVNSQSGGPSSEPASLETPATSKWHNPLDVCRIRTHGGLASPASATFGAWRHPLHRSPYRHQGLDIEAEPGTTIYSVADGRIAFITDPPRGDYGRQLCIIVHKNDLSPEKAALLSGEYAYFFYAHLSEIHSGIVEGKSVICGELLGKTGCTGNAAGMSHIATGSHLHFELRTKERPGRGIVDRQDPVPLIDGFNYPL